ncbi:polyprenyl synthetase family protein [Trichormus variabilis]|uniref:Octaprenyl-diphosphate synthase n=1 Tax=Trichormus variabilis SAG 1403-4b TaxID=447716 RepID=A0A433UQL3_ANAVA|nr:polyprenyl synthetase family protein [Trichormus variabilis]MBD2626336.1 polyprenyl synthetase family protein [Trichormus variabilis FACHB-164]RUS96126.1 octaprenyl-diphosphate synthase [Trichormus variabilis SAG 1403-4b]
MQPQKTVPNFIQLIEFYRERINSLLKNYYSVENVISQPLNRALFYSRRRLRAMLAYCGSGIVGGKTEDADKIAMAYEIITANYVLIDDSIILDGGKIRADMLTPRIEYGEKMALLSACIIQLEPILLLPNHQQIKEIFYQTSRDTIVGLCLEQQLTNLSADTVIDEQQILDISKLMTGSLLAGALTSGAIISGATQAQIDSLSRYAMDFGTAYQISDHIVDILETPENSGKDNFSDITTNKKTIVFNHALQQLPIESSERAEIIGAIGTTPSYQKKQELQRIFRESNSIQHCLDLADKFYSQAILHLQEMPDNEYNSLLKNLPKIYMDKLLISIESQN